MLSYTQLNLLTLNVGFARHNGDWNWKNVRSPFARLYYVTDGEALVELPYGPCRLTPGHLYLVPPFTMHNNSCSGLFSHYYIHIYEPDEKSSLFDEWEFPIEVDAGPADLLLIKRLCEINPFLALPQSDPTAYDNQKVLMNNLRQSQFSPFCDKVESRGILYVLLSRFIVGAKPATGVSDSRMQRIISHMRHHLSEELSLAELASKACMSKDYFIRKFKQATGQTPTVYLTGKRMERAELLLLTTVMPVKQLAREVGYEDVSYFDRLFRKYVGLSPLAYRKEKGGA